MILLWPEGGWWRLADGRVAARGGPADPVPPDSGPVVAVAPGPDVSARWVDLPPMPLPQAAAAARLLAAEFAADPLEALHVAVREPDAAGRRAVALIRLSAMRALLGGWAKRGIDPDHVVPEPFLLAPPADGLTAFERRGVLLLRGPELAAAIEPELAAAFGDPPRLSPRAFEDGLAAALAAAPDLRQGPFARASGLRVERGWARRMARLAAALVLVSLAVPLAEIVKLRRAAARDAAELTAVARAALPPATRVANAPAQLTERIAALRGGGLGFQATVGAVAAAVAADPDLRLEAVDYGADGAARATISASAPQRLAGAADRVRAAGFAASAGPARGEGGRQVADLTVTPP